MLRIGEFSKMSKLTVKTLRYYEEEGLIKPCRVDNLTGYRYYESSQLKEVSKIISLRQLGFSIAEIKKILLDKEDLLKMLIDKKKETEALIKTHRNHLSKINHLIKENTMKQEITIKNIPSCYIYYREGIIENYSALTEFVLKSGEECLALNPGIECANPEYCYVNYLDEEYKETDIKVRYAQAVIQKEEPFNESEDIHFMEIPQSKCICIFHQGSYETLSKSYSKIMKYIEEKGLEIKGAIRECYIDGPWNKENKEDYLSEIQVPII